MAALPEDVRIENLADHRGLVEAAGLLRWREWANGDPDPREWVEVTAREAEDGVSGPITFVAIDRVGQAVGVVGLGPVDGELSAEERAGRTPWILGLVVAREARGLGIGRLLLAHLRGVAADLGHPATWVATGEQAVGFYRRCGWSPIEQLRLTCTGLPTTILTRSTPERK